MTVIYPEKIQQHVRDYKHYVQHGMTHMEAKNKVLSNARSEIRKRYLELCRLRRARNVFTSMRKEELKEKYAR